MAKTRHDELVFLPLGGAGEIGMNLNLYGFGPEGRRKWIILDCGVTFGDLNTPGVEIILPDPAFIAELKDDLLGIVLTHAHEDHMGAVAHLWPRLRASIYATPFTAWLVRDRLREAGLLGQAKVIEIALGARLVLGPFDLELITVTHSIPEPNAVALRTPLGLVLHTGDWKLDDEPMIGAPTDRAALQRLGAEGVLAMICDSTNVLRAGEAGSEGTARAELIRVVAEARGKVAIAAFASNVARMESAVRAGEASGRKVCLVGRSMHRMVSAARAVGILTDVAFVDEDEAGYFPDDKILFLCTGSQGEPRAALSRIAAGAHRHVTLGPGDLVVFSSRVIPGNERTIYALMNDLADKGVEVISDRDRPIHVSGHPCRDELVQMYGWAKPQVAIPVHGEARHLVAHAALARGLGVPQVIEARNGAVVRLAPGPAEVIDEVPCGRLHIDGGVIVDEDHVALKDRKRIAFNGCISIAIALDQRGKIVDGPTARARGLPEEKPEALEGFLDDAADEAEEAYLRLKKDAREDDAQVEDAVGRAVRRLAEGVFDKRPIVDTHVLRV